MNLKEKIAQRVQDYSDYNKQHEFFAVTPQFISHLKESGDRLNSWLEMCQKTNLDVSDYFLSGKRDAVLIFKNGLQLTDSGNRVSFSAVNDKKDVDMNSSMTIVRCSANHLYRQGWDRGVDFSTVRQGSGEMISTFEKSYQETGKMLTQKMIESLKKSK